MNKEEVEQILLSITEDVEKAVSSIASGDETGKILLLLALAY